MAFSLSPPEPLGPSQLGNALPPDVASMVSSMSLLAKRKPIARDLVRRATDLLEQARELDPRIEGRISTALSILSGGDEEKGAGNPRFGGGLTSRRSEEA